MPNTRSKSTSNSRATYSEVDSDVDMYHQELQETTQTDTTRRSKRATSKVDETGGEESSKQSGRAKKKARVAVQEAAETSGSEDEAVEEDASEEAEEQPVLEKGQLEAFLACPLDVLAEICKHLPPSTLLQLARTARLFRNFLLARSARSVWIAARVNAGLPKLKYLPLSEIQYAVLLFGQISCHSCHTASGTRDIESGFILCKACRSLILVKEKDVKKLGLHAETTKCVPQILINHRPHSWRGRVTTYYRSEDLDTVSSELLELQDADEVESEQRALLALRTSGSRTRRASAAGSSSIDPDTPHSEHVKHYVDAKEKWALGHRKERKTLVTALADFNQRAWAARVEELDREKRAQAAKVAQTKSDLLEIGWTEQDYERHQKWSTSSRTDHLKSPKEDTAGWLSVRDAVNSFVDQIEAGQREHQSAQEASKRQAARKALVRDKYDELRDAEEEGTAEWFNFPIFGGFSELPSVKPFWESDPAPEEDAVADSNLEDGGVQTEAESTEVAKAGASQPIGMEDVKPVISPDEEVKEPEKPSLDEEAWKEKLAEILEEVATYRETTRVDTIRTILAATTEIPLRNLSADSSDYPETEYDDTFFSKITSLFFGEIRDSETYQRRWLAVPYPFALHLGQDEAPFELKMNPQGVAALRAILKLGGLDEDTATTEELDEMGPLKWKDFPVYKKGEQEFVWPELVHEVSHRLSKKKAQNLSFSRVQSTPYTTPHPTGFNLRRAGEDSDDEVETEVDAEAEKQ